MSLSKIMRHFEAMGRAPVDLNDVVAQIQGAGLLDKIVVVGVDVPAEKLRGIHYRYTVPARPGSILTDEGFIKIVYSLQQPHDWQRLVICKELVHIYDAGPVTTKAKEEVRKLGAKVAAVHKQFPDPNGDGMQAFFDMVARWRAMAIMFPYSLHEELLPLYEAGKVTIEQIADIVELPAPYVRGIMHDSWKEMRETILD